MHILVVEDDRRLAAVMHKALVEAQHTAEVAHDGAGGEDMATGAAYDLIVLDRLLPGLDGLELCRRLRAAGSDVPVLIVSAGDDVEDCVAGFDAGADDYLAKPFALEELLARLHALGRRAGTLAHAPVGWARGGERAAPEAAASGAAQDRATMSRARGLIGSLRHAWARRGR